MASAATVAFSCLAFAYCGGCSVTTPEGWIPLHSFEVNHMARKPVFHSSKLSKAENTAVNKMIKRSWINGRRSGFRAAFASKKRSKGAS